MESVIKWLARRVIAVRLWFEDQKEKDRVLHTVATSGDAALVGLLLSSGARTDAADGYGWQPLHRAAWRGNCEVIDLLIAAGAKIDAADILGGQPLHRAVIMGRKEAVELLLAKGAKVDARAGNRWSPLHYAAANGHRDVAAVLVEHGADPTALNDEGQKPTERCKDQAVREFLQKAEKEWKTPEEREREALAALRARQRKLGSLRPKVPSL